jgi:type IV pilus assembly protein PilV
MPTPKNRAFFALFMLCMSINKPLLLIPSQLFFKPTHSVRKQQGFSMIELLVAMLIFSIGLLGLASLQVTGLRMTRDAELMGRANLLASTMAEKIRAQPSALTDVENWKRTIQTTLPAGRGDIKSVNRTHTISVAWVESQDSTLVNHQRSYELVIQR